MNKTVEETELETKLAWRLNSKLRERFRELYMRMGYSDLLPKANAGEEIVDLVIAIFKREEKTGLARFYELLVELAEKTSLELIRDSPAAPLFKKDPAVPVINNGNHTKLLCDLGGNAITTMAEEIGYKDEWKKIGLYFQPEVKYEALKAKHRDLMFNGGDIAYCKVMIDTLANQGVYLWMTFWMQWTNLDSKPLHLSSESSSHNSIIKISNLMQRISKVN